MLALLRSCKRQFRGCTPMTEISKGLSPYLAPKCSLISTPALARKSSLLPVSPASTAEQNLCQSWLKRSMGDGSLGADLFSISKTLRKPHHILQRHQTSPPLLMTLHILSPWLPSRLLTLFIPPCPLQSFSLSDSMHWAATTGSSPVVTLACPYPAELTARLGWLKNL